MKEIMFSRQFPATHPRKGEETYFIEKIINGLDGNGKTDFGLLMFVFFISPFLNYTPKYHTIRKGNRHKVGDKVNFKVWTDKPYRSKKETFAREVEIKKVWDFEMDENGVYSINGKYADNKLSEILAGNDGLSDQDLYYWFMTNPKKPKPFKGQIICWNDKVIY